MLLAIKAQASHLSVADLPTLAGAFSGEIKTSLGLGRIRQLMSIAGDIDGSSIHRVVLVPPYTSDGFIGGQSVVIGDWSAIVPLVHQSFP